MERTYVTTSLEVARVANRKHGQVLRDIDRLRVLLPDTKAPEFEAARRTDAKGNSLRYYLLTPYALALLDVGQIAIRPISDKLHADGGFFPCCCLTMEKGLKRP